MTTVRSRPLVLVVDDDFAMRLLASETLGAEFDVVEAEDGENAVMLFIEHAPDAVLLDVVMDGIDGYETCRRIRSLGAVGVPILMMTGRDDVEAIDASYHAGATDFITKPIPYALLAHRVRYLLRAALAFKQEREAIERLSRAQRLAGLVQWDLDLRDGTFRWSDEAYAVFGIPVPEARTSVDAMLRHVHPDDVATVERALLQGTSHQLDYRMILADGRERLIHQEAERWDDRETGAQRLLGATQDVTERRQAESRATHLTYYDGLTGLPNRTQLRAVLARALAAYERHGHPLALLAIDIDHLKRINDLLGHAAGDAALIETAKRLSNALRRVSGRASVATHDASMPLPASLVARLDGDAFAVLLPNLTSRERASAIACALLDEVAAPFSFDGTEITLTATIGIATTPENGQSAAELFKHADAALHLAKSECPGGHRFFSDALRASVERRMLIELGLSEALERCASQVADRPCELELHFQPKVSSATRRTAGVEALVRWRSPRLGNVSPAEFVSVAEDCDLMIPLGAWVLRTACVAACGVLSDIAVAVNISPRQFLSPDFVDFVATVLDETGLDPSRLELEITEGVVMQDTERSQRVLLALKALGVRIVLDDFGTGYSSLGYLLRFPIDGLKIDRSFIKDLPCARNESIVGAIVAMSDSLGIDVVVEGVETEEQLAVLSRFGDLDIQGYYFSKPLPRDALRAWLDARARPLADAGRPRLSSYAPASWS